MKIVKIYGGLGNQMFQYAFAKELEHRFPKEVFIDTFWGNKNTIHHGYELDTLFNIDIKEADEKAIKKLSTSPDNLLLKIRRKYFTKKTHYIDKDFIFSDKIFKTTKDCYYEGYWQSEDFFSSVKKEIKEIYKFKLPLDEDNLELLKNAGKNSLSIHVRRGDYLKEKSLNVCNLEYYQNALNKILSEEKISGIIFFSNDIDWCKKNIKTDDIPTFYSTKNTGKNSWKDMALMSLCSHNIIANSSFSWWAAYLNDNKNKKILCPKTWGISSTKKSYYHFNFSRVCPQDWIKISTE